MATDDSDSSHNGGFTLGAQECFVARMRGLNLAVLDACLDCAMQRRPVLSLDACGAAHRLLSAHRCLPVELGIFVNIVLHGRSSPKELSRRTQ